MITLVPLALLAVLGVLGAAAVMVLRGSPDRKTREVPAEKKSEPYGFWSRLILFMITAAVLGLIFGGIFVRLGIGAAMTAGGGSGAGFAGAVLLACPLFLIVAGYHIFKR